MHISNAWYLPVVRGGPLHLVFLATQAHPDRPSYLADQSSPAVQGGLEGPVPLADLALPMLPCLPVII